MSKQGRWVAPSRPRPSVSSLHSPALSTPTPTCGRAREQPVARHDAKQVPGGRQGGFRRQHHVGPHPRLDHLPIQAEAEQHVRPVWEGWQRNPWPDDSGAREDLCAGLREREKGAPPRVRRHVRRGGPTRREAVDQAREERSEREGPIQRPGVRGVRAPPPLLFSSSPLLLFSSSPLLLFSSLFTLAASQGWPAFLAAFCSSRRVRSRPSVTASKPAPSGPTRKTTSVS